MSKNIMTCQSFWETKLKEHLKLKSAMPTAYASNFDDHFHISVRLPIDVEMVVKIRSVNGSVSILY